jgi:hypothetical protein
MAQLYTSDQLVRFVYRETGILQSLEIENALATDAEWQRTHQNFSLAKQALPKVSFAPRNSTIDAILRYSAESARGVSLA